MFPRASRAYVEYSANPKARTDPLVKAWQEYAGGGEWSGPGDSSDAYVALCFRGRTPFAEDEVADFERWSNVLWARALSCAAKEKA